MLCFILGMMVIDNPMLTMELIFLHGKLSLPHFTKGMSFRQIKMRMIKHPRFNKILDNKRVTKINLRIEKPQAVKECGSVGYEITKSRI